MEPTATLRHEHEVVCRTLAGADALADTARESGAVDVAAVRDFIEFAGSYTEGSHGAKEERFLFPRLCERDAKAESPVATMLREHDGARERVHRLQAALDAVAAGDGSAVATVVENLSAYGALLRSHIAQEHNVVFHLADQLLTEADRRELTQAFEGIEQEIGLEEHQRLAAIADRLGHIAEQHEESTVRE
jgi:hemerythrin-like domain-containing protein